MCAVARPRRSRLSGHPHIGVPDGSACASSPRGRSSTRLTECDRPQLPGGARALAGLATPTAGPSASAPPQAPRSAVGSHTATRSQGPASTDVGPVATPALAPPADGAWPRPLGRAVAGGSRTCRVQSRRPSPARRSPPRQNPSVHRRKIWPWWTCSVRPDPSGQAARRLGRCLVADAR